MNYCPCCSNLLLQHIRGSESYWFCRTCWQEMPTFTWKNSDLLPEILREKIPKSFQKRELMVRANHLSKQQSIIGWIGT